MKFTINNNLRLLTCPLLLAGAVCCSSGNDGDTPAPGPGPDPSPVTGDVLAYVTSADGNRLFTEEGLDYSKVSMSPYRVTIDPSTTYQTVDGFGPAITGATCYNLLQMSQADRTAILRKCFDPETGAGFSFIRVHIGGSDFSMDEYTCCDREGIEFFAIPAVEKDGIFPVLKEILEINPEIKIMGSPWSCPKWMKGTVADPSKPYDSWTSGRLNPAYYDDYAEYFVQWVTEMEENGFPIYAITIQNEPLNHGNSMSLYMPWEDQLAFVKKLGPAFRKAGIDMPTFCYYSELSVHGACRMCIVENVKTGKIDASCSMEPRDGLEIRTNTSRLLQHRRLILELLLASHDCSCTTCAKSGNCRLQALAQRFGVSRVRFPDTRERYEQDNTSPAIFRDPNKCILCGDCVRVCEELQGQGILNYAHRGSELQVMPAFDKKLDQTKCVGCGQCAAVCTTGAYNYSMASNYNRLPRPAVVMLTPDRIYEAVRRETFADLTALDL